MKKENTTNITKKEIDELHKKIDALDKKIDTIENFRYLLSYGIDGYKKKVLNRIKRESRDTKIKFIESMFADDPGLNQEHKTILSFLVKQYDLEKGSFMRIPLSSIARTCKLNREKVRKHLNSDAVEWYVKKQTIDGKVTYCIKR